MKWFLCVFFGLRSLVNKAEIVFAFPSGFGSFACGNLHKSHER